MLDVERLCLVISETGQGKMREIDNKRRVVVPKDLRRFMGKGELVMVAENDNWLVYSLCLSQK
jgi:DNA-binding transcriptional regulator/RsmH inhibitor MraZ